VLVAHRCVARLRRYRPVAAVAEQPVRLLIADSRLQEGSFALRVTPDDVRGVLRTHGVAREADMRFLVYENKGVFSIVRRDQPVDEEPAAAALRGRGPGPTTTPDPGLTIACRPRERISPAVSPG
jgi:hypothetical protein